MAIGGYREGAGRKREWNAQTGQIRLPIEQHERLKQIAKLVDNGETLIVVTESGVVTESELIKEIQAVVDSERGRPNKLKARSVLNKLKLALGTNQ